MRIKTKHRVVAIMLLVLLVFTSLGIGLMISPTQASASNDNKSQSYGFSVDSDYYNVQWNWRPKYIYLKIDDNRIGEVEINVGKAITKEPFDDSGRYLITYMIRAKTKSLKATYTQRHRFLWKTWTTSYDRYGWFKDVTLTSTLRSGTELFDSWPKYYAQDTSYSLGASVQGGSSGVSGGISAGVSFTSKAIDITNHSNSYYGNVDISIHLNTSCFRWNWGRYKYAQQDNCQLFCFSVLSYSKYSSQTLNFSSEFGTSPKLINSYWDDIYGGSTYGSTSFNY